MEETQALNKIKSVIKKSRVHFYKPFQIAEILYQIRNGNKSIDALDLETYRTHSKRWRDAISCRLTGNICSSSSKFQDDLFSESACPPEVIQCLSNMNIDNNASIEKLIYNLFQEKTAQLLEATQYLQKKNSDFILEEFLDLFWSKPGLRRSLDKVFEIVIYAIFQTITEELDVESSIYINCNEKTFNKFNSFSKKVLGINLHTEKITSKASFYRLGVANASDRGLDMYSNTGSIVQVKHLSLSEELAKEVVSRVSSESVVIVCKSSEQETITSLINQIGWKSKIKGIVTLDDLSSWYKICLESKDNQELGIKVINMIKTQMSLEFPSTYELDSFMTERGY